MAIYPNRKVAGTIPDDFLHFYESPKVRLIFLDEIKERFPNDPFIQALILTTIGEKNVFKQEVEKVLQFATQLHENEWDRLLNFF